MSSIFVISYIILWFVVVTLFIGVFALYHHFGQMYLNTREGRANQGPALLDAPGALIVSDVRGASITLPQPRIPTLVLFATTRCPLCKDLLPAVSDFAQSQSQIETVVVCGDERDAVLKWVGDDVPTVATVIPDAHHSIAARYRISATPFLVAIDGRGRVQMKGIINDDEGLKYGARVLNGDQRSEEEVRGRDRVASLDNYSSRSTAVH